MLRYTIAGLMLGAAGIHFAMMGEHAGVSWTHGTVLRRRSRGSRSAIAATILLRPSRSVALGVHRRSTSPRSTVWVLTRTVGIAIGSDGDARGVGPGRHRVRGVRGARGRRRDVAALHPGQPPADQRRGRRRPAPRSSPSVVAAVDRVRLQPRVRDGGPDGTSADGHDHGAVTAASAAGGHTHGAPVDDKGLALLHNGHHAEIGPEQPLSATDRTELSRQMAATIEVARRLPTPTEALAAGYHQTGPYMPGIGAHFIKIGGPSLNGDGVLDDADLQEPLAIIYDGVSPDARVAGFMYYSTSKTAPKGFAGPNDHWHFHTSLCLKYGPGGAIDLPYGFDVKIPKAQCDALGGTLLQQSQWMVHVWSVPGLGVGPGPVRGGQPRARVPRRQLLPAPDVEVARPPRQRVSERDLAGVALSDSPRFVVDLAGRGRPVQRVEVQAGRAAVDQRAGELRRLLDADREHRVRDRRRRPRACRRASAGSRSPAAVTCA